MTSQSSAGAERTRPRPTLRTLKGAEFSRLLGIGDYRPQRVISNEEMCRYIDSSDEWIRERSGITQRYQAAPEESVVDMGAAAGQAALDHAGLAGSDIDAVIVASVTWPWQTPAAAPLIAHRVGAGTAAAYDLAAACAGYCYAVATADDLIRAGRAEHVLVVGVEKLSDYRNLQDRGTAFIFGDGAGAVVVGPSDTPGISATTWGSDGANSGLIVQSTSWISARTAFGPGPSPLDRALPPGEDGGEEVLDARAGAPPAELAAATGDPRVWPFVDMSGPSVFRWAVSKVAPMCLAALEAAGVTAEDLDVFIPHQANARIVDAMVKRMKLPAHVVVADDIALTANTSAASVPLATAALLRDGRARSGDLALQIGFGAGLTWAAQVVVLP